MRVRHGDRPTLAVGIWGVTRQVRLLMLLTAPIVGCDATGPTPTLALRVGVSPAAILAGGSDTATIRVTVVNLTALPVERVVTCDNLFAVESLVGRVVVSNYRVTCPAENSIPLIIQLGPFASAELVRRWTGVSVRYADGGYEAVALPPGAYRVFGALGDLRSQPELLQLTAP